MSLRVFLPLYTVLWAVGLPAVLVYLWLRGRRDPGYRAHLGERFGRYAQRMDGAVWVHAVSLGEVRSAVSFLRALLDRGDRVVVTHLTPAGRQETKRLFAPEIAAGQVAAVWLPFEFAWAYRRFFASFHPRAGLVMEVEHWPRMILAAEAARVPLFPCNAQYPAASFARDRTARRWRSDLMRHYAGAFVKSDLQAERFRATGLRGVVVTGETRFDQPIPQALVAAGLAVRTALARGRPVVTIASAVEGEDPIYLAAIATLGPNPPLIVYVPRRPERFDEVAAALGTAGLRILRRSDLGRDFAAPSGALVDVLLGDSLGEMVAYLAMADRVVVGGGFTPKGAHNIIEALAMGKPVLTGPVTWPIEYPFREAEEAGLARSVPDAEALAAALAVPAPVDPARIAAFVAAHSGAAMRTLAALDAATSR